MAPSLNNGAYSDGYAFFTPSHELTDAVDHKLLSQEEARTIYYNQFPILRQQAIAASEVNSLKPPALN